MNRRKFLKTAAAVMLLGPSLYKKCAHAVEKDKIFGSCLRKVWHRTTAESILVPTTNRKQSFIRAKAEPWTCRNDFISSNVPLKNEPKSLAFFGQITDVHIVDEESPCRLVAAEPYLQPLGAGGGFRPQEDLIVWVMDSMIKTLNQITSIVPFDFVLNTGDISDNAHRNEVEWFLKLLEGDYLDPDSGVNEDPLAGPNNDGNDAFLPEGFRAGMPIYSVIGNHDVLFQGNIPVSFRETYNKTVGWLLDFMKLNDPLGVKSNAVVKPWVNPPNPADLKPGEVVKDSRRQPDAGQDFIHTHTSYPTSRPCLGFPGYLSGKEEGYYAVKPIPGKPIKVIVLDTAIRLGTALGALDDVQFEEFLIPELEKAKKRKRISYCSISPPRRRYIHIGSRKRRTA